MTQGDILLAIARVAARHEITMDILCCEDASVEIDWNIGRGKTRSMLSVTVYPDGTVGYASYIGGIARHGRTLFKDAIPLLEDMLSQMRPTQASSDSGV